MKTDSLFPITCFFLNWHVLTFWFNQNICPCCLAAELCLILCSPMDFNLPGSSVCGVSQWVLEWVSISFSRGSSWPRNWTHVSCIEGNSLPFEPPWKPIKVYTPKQIQDGGREIIPLTVNIMCHLGWNISNICWYISKRLKSAGKYIPFIKRSLNVESQS